MIVKSFDAVADGEIGVLVLGSVPGATSLKLNQYYAHKGNAFWHIMGEICGADPALPYEKRVEALLEAGAGIWDVLQYCEREGSLDARIDEKTEVPNDFNGFLAAHPQIRAIFFNGKKAAKSFDKHVKPNLRVEQEIYFGALPSTSPAHAIKKQEKVRLWREIEGFLKG